MTSRRDVLRIGVAGAVLLPFDWLEAWWARARDPLYKFIFDERFPTSVALARDVNGRGIRIHGIRGDVTALWYSDLYFRWKDGPAPIAGITTKDSLFCLELLARDASLRVTDRRALDEGLVSWSIGPKAGGSMKGPRYG
jgi:hypothetical protein